MIKAKIILDTDVGIDCDDMGAIAMLINFEKSGIAEIVGVASCVARPYAPACIKAISDEYDANFPIAGLRDGFIQKDNYSEKIANMYGFQNFKGEEYISFYRQKLSTAENNSITLVAIGPLFGLDCVLRSRPDGISNFTGVELFEKKVKSVYVMGGYFGEPNTYFDGYGTISVEWNFESALAEACSFIKQCPTEIVFCPFELGVAFKTGEMLIKRGGVGAKAYEIVENGRLRFSWDPATIYVAVKETNTIFAYSNFGTVAITASGTTTFKENIQGRHRILTLRKDAESARLEIEKYMC